MLMPILEYESNSAPAKGYKNHKQRSNASRDKVKQIVEASREPAEPKVTLVLIPHHGIEGIHHFIGEHKRHSTQCVVKERGNNAIAKILGKGFKHRGADAVGIEVSRVAPHNET
jgi:hypothetical protein